MAYVDGRTVGRQARAASGERRPTAGRNRGIGRRRAGQNRDVTPGAWFTRTDGRAGTGNPTAERRDGLFILRLLITTDSTERLKCMNLLRVFLDSKLLNHAINSALKTCSVTSI